jgi:GNAT superfamily N-acetyltransferase
VFAGVDSVMTEAKALGLAGPVSGEDAGRLEEFYFSRGAAAKVWICPLADPSLVAVLAERGYRPAEFETILFRTLDDLGDLPEAPAGVVVDRAAPGESELYADLVIPAFVHPAPVTPEFRKLGLAAIRMPGSTPFLARIGGRPVGGGTAFVRDDLVVLAGAATVPEFRNRGVQTALSRARLAHAASVGCTLAMQGAQPGSTSQRTAERLGFRVAYTKLMLRRDAP